MKSDCVPETKGRAITRAYWPVPAENRSADREAGNKLVDEMTLEELVEFFKEYDCGPTFCLVRERVFEQLKRLPPRLNIADAQTQASRALETLKLAIQRLNRETGIDLA